jgi:hypothetical protein
MYCGALGNIFYGMEGITASCTVSFFRVPGAGMRLIVTWIIAKEKEEYVHQHGF